MENIRLTIKYMLGMCSLIETALIDEFSILILNRNCKQKINTKHQLEFTIQEQWGSHDSQFPWSCSFRFKLMKLKNNNIKNIAASSSHLDLITNISCRWIGYMIGMCGVCVCVYVWYMALYLIAHFHFQWLWSRDLYPSQAKWRHFNV